MEKLSKTTHVFLLRVWIEHRRIEGKSPLLRGLIEHVGSDDKVYIKDLNEISEFVHKFFASQGPIEPSRGFLHWLKNRR